MGYAYNSEEYEEIVMGVRYVPCNRGSRRGILIRMKRCEMEVMRDRKDNCVVICSIENLDPMGVHKIL